MEETFQENIQEKAVILKASKKDTLWLLNVIRGLSAILIVLYHYTVQYEASIGHLQAYAINVRWGCYAVYTFFILSGFLTVYTYNEQISARNFLKKRFLRLYPMFWICMVITTVYMIVLLPERVPTIKQFILNLTMLPSLFGVDAVDGVYWTLAKDLMFYIGFSVLIILGVVKNDLLWFWAWLIFDVAYVFLPQKWIISTLFIPEYLFAFLAGMAIFYLNNNETFKEKVPFIIYLIVCILLCIKYHPEKELIVFFILALITLIFCSRSSINEKLLEIKWVFQPLLFLSEISYVLYLTHQFIGFGIFKFIESHGMIGEVWMLIPLSHAIILASLLHFGIEVKLNKFLKKLK